MFSLLDPRLWGAFLLAVALSGGVSYFKGRHDGKVLERATVAAGVAKANIESFAVTEHRQRNADEASTVAAQRAIDDRKRGAAADLAIGRMRGTLDATQRHAQESLTAASATVAAYRAVFESCTAEYRSVGEDAAGHARDSLMYQNGWPR